ncbi:MAG: hypothetical protein J6K74_07900 [Marinifilaceae bacterium]|nr:hypothetical protein [Marinifilaceae bacterium]
MATKISATNIMPAHAFGPYEAYAGLTEAQKGQFIHFNTDPEDSEFSGTIAFRGFLFGKGRIPTAVTNMGDGTIKITMKGTDDIVSTSLKASKTTFGFVKTTDSISEANNDVSLVPTYSVVYALYQDKAPKANPVFTGVPQAPTPTSDTTLTQIATIEYVRNKIAANDAMRYCGTLGTGGDVSELPSISLDTVKNGDKYVVASAGTYNGIPCKVGDSFIANKINNNIADKWNYIPSANENETLLHYTTSPSAVTLTTTSKYGTIILGSAATKIAAISGNTSASNSDEYVPTVKYLENSVATLRNDEILTKVGSISSTTL